MLELQIAPQDVPRLFRAPALLACRGGRARSQATSMIWHDTANGALAARDLTLARSDRNGREAWVLERLRPNGAMDWLPCHPAPILAQAATRTDIVPEMAGLDAVAPIAAFTGRKREFPLTDASGPASLSVLDGTLRGVTQDRPECRVILSGDAVAMARLAQTLAGSVALRVPRAGLAAEALAVARGETPAARHAGAPRIPPGCTISEALRLTCAHLADVILHWSALVQNGQDGEPVHQMRVGVRRLRSALSAFGRAVQPESGAAPWLDELATALQAMAARLGTARDWDVFLSETAAAIRQALPPDRRFDRLLSAAETQRSAAYTALSTLFASPDWRRLEMTLALLPTLQPWLPEDAAPEHAARLGAPVEDFAAHALERRLRHVLAPGNTLAHLAPAQLHDIRKHAKRLRYAAEIFADLFPRKAVRKYLSRLETLQEILGVLNDATVAAALMGQLGGGGERAFAAGVVQGFGAARAADAHAKLEKTWTKFYFMTPFWD